MAQLLVAGAAAVHITPQSRQFLFGYPHVRRYSTGVHDPLFSSALFLSDGRTPLLLVANDVIFIGHQTARRVRERIEGQTQVPAANIMITATHTHSGPMTTDMLSNEADEAVPRTDPRYVEQLEDGIVQAAVEACRGARPVQVGLGVADGSCVGTNRHDPAGPADPQVPVLIVRDLDVRTFVAAMTVCSMHPTVLHEDSTLVSGDFPAMTRRWLQEHVLGPDCPVVYHTGPCGNQSPRHVTKGNTFEEVERLGGVLGRSIAEVITSIDYTQDVTLDCARGWVDLPARVFPPVDQAQEQLDQAAQRLETLRRSGADHRAVRTAECDWFGAEEGLVLARAAADGRLEALVASLMPAEIVLMRIGRWSFVGWPGETFVEFSLMVKQSHPDCYMIGLANGELQGYLVTEESVRQRRYESLNSLFSSPESGLALASKTCELLEAL
jgi:hypothetical protein